MIHMKYKASDLHTMYIMYIPSSYFVDFKLVSFIGAPFHYRKICIFGTCMYHISYEVR